MDHAICATGIELNPSSKLPPQRSYVILGLERGGTSAVAGAARALGLFLGGPEMEGNNEDPLFQRQKLAAMRSAVRLRNDQHDVWGWKYPNAASYLPLLMQDLRHPRFIVVYRDVVATAMSRNKWDGQFLRRRPHYSVHEASSGTTAATSFALASACPTLLLSHEKLMHDTPGLTSDLARFLGRPQPSESFVAHLARYLAPGSYKRFADWFSEAGDGIVPIEPPVSEPSE